MRNLADMTLNIRSKNAGPFWVTIDLFFADTQAYSLTCQSLTTQAVAERLGLDAQNLKRFELDDISVIKFSFPRPVVQGHRLDRDMHGAQYAWLLNGLEISV